MIRTQISLTPEQHRRLSRAARERGTSIAAIIRDAVERELPDEDEERRRRFERSLRVIGIARSGKGDIAEEHDRYLGELDRW